MVTVSSKIWSGSLVLHGLSTFISVVDEPFTDSALGGIIGSSFMIWN